MRKVELQSSFRKDMKRCIRRGCDPAKALDLVKKIQENQPLPASARPHILQGEYAGMWECHAAPDWLLIYTYTDEELVMVRTGTHADLFEYRP